MYFRCVFQYNYLLKSKVFMKFFTLLTVLIATSSLAQNSNFNTQRNWSLNKKELLFGIGATQFLGDLGGRNRVGTDYSLSDIDFPSTGIGGMIGFRYRFHPYYATTTSLNVGLVRGSDANTNEIIRESRNLQFRSLIVELSQRFEVILLANEKFGRRYNIRGLKGFRDHNEQLYLFGGIGVAYYNPKAPYQGSWVALRPLHTEGQGLAGGPDEYSKFTATIPLGIGFRMGLTRMWRIGLELTYVKTFTDYIDDVSGTYYDPSVLAAKYGEQAAYLSNPSDKNQQWFTAGQQRGDKNLDAYFYANIVVVRNITYKNYANKSRRIRFNSRTKF